MIARAGPVTGQFLSRWRDRPVPAALLLGDEPDHAAPMRAASVPTMMTRVETSLVLAARRRGGVGAGGPILVATEGDAELGIASLRETATIRLEFQSGSDRPVVGAAVRLGKRVIRRGLRWYSSPPWEQQNRFNHSLLDLIETLRLQNERLRSEVERLTLPPDDKAEG